MERTCNGCAALVRDHKQYECGLKFKIFLDYINPEIAPVPLEECPKPRTCKELFSLNIIK